MTSTDKQQHAHRKQTRCVSQLRLHFDPREDQPDFSCTIRKIKSWHFKFTLLSLISLLSWLSITLYIKFCGIDIFISSATILILTITSILGNRRRLRCLLIYNFYCQFKDLISFLYLMAYQLSFGFVLVWFDGISTIVGYLMPNPLLYIYIKYLIFKHIL